MVESVRIQVVMKPELSERFSEYCREQGFKKSTLIVRLVRDHLEREGFRSQPELSRDFERSGDRGGR